MTKSDNSLLHQVMDLRVENVLLHDKIRQLESCREYHQKVMNEMIELRRFLTDNNSYSKILNDLDSIITYSSNLKNTYIKFVNIFNNYCNVETSSYLYMSDDSDPFEFEIVVRSGRISFYISIDKIEILDHFEDLIVLECDDDNSLKKWFHNNSHIIMEVTTK